MMHKPIFLRDICLSFPHKNCFENFSSQIYPGSRIAVIGRNGSGKSALLNILRQKLSPSCGQVIMPDNLSIGYVEQTIRKHDDLSGGQRFQKKLSEALAGSPDLLLLDEPTNHLDIAHRKHLIRMLQAYQGTVVVASHDVVLLRKSIATFWHINHNKIYVFSGSYDDYIRETEQKYVSLQKESSLLKREKKQTHAALMKEQKRATKSRSMGEKAIEQKKWPTIVHKSKARRAEQTTGKKKSAVDRKKQNIAEQLSDLQLPETILPKFSLDSGHVSSGHILSISDADIGYGQGNRVLRNINLSVSARARVALCGDNASGKSTLLKAIAGSRDVWKTGLWHWPNAEHIGYLDQHYANLDPALSAIDHMRAIRPAWNEIEIRKHLNAFLFRKNEEVLQEASTLSGGEKARLSLSLIAARPPRLLILDEITNNLDRETRNHVIEVLKVYPGAMIVVSHDEDFLQSIHIDRIYTILSGGQISSASALSAFS